MDRHTLNASERAEVQEIEKSLKTSTYISNPEFWENIHQGIPTQSNVPNYKQPTKGEVLGSLASESDGMHMDIGGLYNTATDILGPEQTKLASQNSLNPRQSGEKTFTKGTNPSFTISRNQAMAIKKYPALIEFLGKEEGTKIASNISEHLNVFIAERIQKNTKKAHNDALECKIDKQNFKQYFQGKDWICRVTASGPFKGDEVIYYSRDKDTACILRKVAAGEQIRYEDISTNFNIIYEAGQIPEEITEENIDSSETKTETVPEGEN